MQGDNSLEFNVQEVRWMDDVQGWVIKGYGVGTEVEDQT